MTEPVIITCAPTRGMLTPSMSPHLPITPCEITTASIEAAEACASIIHSQARNAETGTPDPIKQSSDAVVNISTSGGLGMSIGDLGHLYNVKWFANQGLIKPPFFIQMVFGILGGVGAGIDNLMHIHKIAGKLFGVENHEWSVLGTGMVVL